MNIRRIVREILKEEMQINPSGDIFGKGEIDAEMEGLQYSLEAEISDKHKNEKIGPFHLDFDDDGIHWVTDSGKYLVDADLFHNNNFVMKISLYKIVEPGEEGELSLGEWEELRSQEYPLDPSILQGHLEHIEMKYMSELEKFINDISRGPNLGQPGRRGSQLY